MVIQLTDTAELLIFGKFFPCNLRFKQLLFRVELRDLVESLSHGHDHDNSVMVSEQPEIAKEPCVHRHIAIIVVLITV